MSWLNLNQSFNSIKGQITTFATEVLSEGTAEDSVENPSGNSGIVNELEEKCRNQELEIASLKKLNDELQVSLQSERLAKRNGVRDEESSWYWDPPESSKPARPDVEDHYKSQIRSLQDELSTLRERDTVDIRHEEEVNRLREENRNLTMSLEDLDSQHQLAMERLLALKKELQKNFELLKQEHDDLKNTNEEFSIEIKTLQSKLREKNNEVDNVRTIQSDYDTLHHKYQNLERVHSILKEHAEKFQEENQELNEENFKLQEQVTKLEHDLEIATKNTEISNTVPKDKYEQVLKELNELKDRRNMNQVHLDEVNIDDNAKSVIENLKREINDLKRDLTKESQSLSQETGDFRIKTDKVMQFYNKYINFELPIDYVGEMPSSGDNSVLFKLENVFKTINGFKKNIDTLEHQLSERNHDNKHLQTQIEDITSENDFLTNDIQHLERELSEMKKNNDFLISEIAALKNTSKLEPIAETHEDNLVKLESELADCNRINKSFESEIKRIEKELKEVRADKIVLQESLQDFKTKYTTMLEELETCKTHSKEMDQLEANSTLQHDGQIKNMSDEIDDLKKRLNSTNAKNEQLAIDTHIIENDKVLLTKEVDDLKHELEKKSSEHKELESLKGLLDHKLQELEYKLDDVLKHNQEIDTHRSELQEKVKLLECHHTQSPINNVDLEKVALEKVELLNKNASLNETIDNLEHNISTIKRRADDLEAENSSLKNSVKAECETVVTLQKTIEDLKSKAGASEIISKEILSLKEENRKLDERKQQLETELLSTDEKILQLEKDFDKLVHDLQDKDNIIESLKSTITNNNVTAANLKQNVLDLENGLAAKNQEITLMKQSLDELNDKLNNTKVEIVNNQDQVKGLLKEKEDLDKELVHAKDKLVSKDAELLSLNTLVNETKKTCDEYKTLVENKEKEIKELNQSMVEISDKIKANDNLTHNDDYASVVEEKDALLKEFNETKAILNDKEKIITELQSKCLQVENHVAEYAKAMDTSTSEKAELINLINLKHNESLQYHNEIQRLNNVLLEQTNEFKRIIEEKDKSLQRNNENCSSCEVLRITLKEKDEIIMRLNQSSNEFDRASSELAAAHESVKVLTEKCSNLEKNLTVQLENVKKLTAQNVQLSEQEQNSTKELERLRHHLVEMEENYTQELMTSEQKLSECQSRLQHVEERAKQTSTVYTSNSIRANQEVETLRNQIRLMEKQRDDVQTRLSEAEDARSRSEAALTNLQVVLEQFQLDKERDISSATEKIRNQMEELKQTNRTLQQEIQRLNKKLEESLAGLQAATRLGDQVETKSAQINDLKEQVRVLQTTVQAAEERYYNAISNQQDKVDKNLVKNLVINYVLAIAQNNSSKSQMLRILSTVLDFNRAECTRVGLTSRGAPSESLAREFVKFLEDESRPRAPLPNIMGIADDKSSSSRRSSTLGPQPTPQELGHKRNPSTGSNNLLFQNIEPDQSVAVSLDTGVTQPRDTEGAILKHVLRDM